MPDLRRFIEELKRRHVFRVAVVYGVIAWLTMQVSATVTPALSLPDWTTTLVIVLLCLGFPIALVLAWAFEMSPDGIRPTRWSTASAGDAGPSATGSATGSAATPADGSATASRPAPVDGRPGSGAADPVPAGSEAAVVPDVPAPLPAAAAAGTAVPSGAPPVPDRAGRSDGASRTPSAPPTLRSAEGERKQTCILISQLSGYVGLVERLPPAELEDVMDRIQDRVGGVLARHGGVLNEFSGERMVALFGIPTAHEDDLLRAARAALETHAAVRALNEDPETCGGAAFCMRSGIDAGLVVAREANRGDGVYRVAGTAMETAGRLCAATEAGEILVSPDCRRRLAPYFRLEAGEPLSFGSRTAPVVPYRVAGETGLRTRLDAAESRGLTAYTGRERELRMLEEALGRCLAGEGGLVAVIGETGVGKSRLLYEFRRAMDPDRVNLLEGRCPSDRFGAPYEAWVEALRDGLGLNERDVPDVADADEIARRIGDMAPELVDSIPLYLHLLAASSDRFPLPAHLAGEHLPAALREALSAFFTLRAHGGPVLLILEDWHSADRASREVLSQVAEMAPAHPLMVVATSRPEAEMAWGTLAPHATIKLGPLESGQSMAIIKSVLGAETIPANLGHLLHERTDGNPFFLEEVCEALLERKAVTVAEGTAVLAGTLEKLQLPDSVQGVIQTRLDHLSAETRDTLRLAAVVGREFGRALLERAYMGGEGTAASLSSALDTLRGVRLIQQVRALPEPGYRFKHALTREVAYESLLLHQRQELHGRVGRAMEELYPDDVEEHAARLAHHFAGAEEWPKAVRYGRTAAVRAASFGQSLDALETLDRVLEWGAKIAPADARRAARIGLLFLQERLCEPLGRRDRQLEIIEELISLLERRDGSRLAEAYLRLGDVNTLLRRFDEAGRALDESLRISRESGDAMAERSTLRSMGLLHWHQRHDREALDFMQQALSLNRRRGDIVAMIGDLANMATVLRGMGELAQARRHLEEALEFCEGLPAGLPAARAEPNGAAGRDLLAADLGGPGHGGTPDRGADGIPHWSAGLIILYGLGTIHRELGEHQTALDYLERATTLAKEQRLDSALAHTRTIIAHVYLQQGRTEEALDHYLESVELWRATEEPDRLGHGLRILGQVLVGLGKHAQALVHLREAAAIFTRLQHRESELLLVWDVIATAHERGGQYDEAAMAWGEVRRLRRKTRDREGELSAAENVARCARRTDPEEGLRLYEEALALAEDLDDGPRQAALLNSMGIVEWERGGYERALEHYQRALGLFRTLQDDVHAGLTLNSIGTTLKALGRPEEACVRLEEAIALNRRTGRRLLEGHGLAVLGDLHMEMGDSGEARRRYESSLELRRALGDRNGEGWMLQRLARLSAEEGSPERAAALVGQALEIAEECGDPKLARAARASGEFAAEA